MFLIPHQLLSGGVSGIAMIVGYFTSYNIGFLYLLFNLPLMIWGLVSIGRRFIMISVAFVILTTWMLQIIPTSFVAKDSILGAVFGGVLIGMAAVSR